MFRVTSWASLLRNYLILHRFILPKLRNLFNLFRIWCCWKFSSVIRELETHKILKKVSVYWDMTHLPTFWGTYFLQASCKMLLVSWAYFSKLKMEAVLSSKMWVHFYQTAWHCITEGSTTHNHCHKDLKSHKVYVYSLKRVNIHPFFFWSFSLFTFFADSYMEEIYVNFLMF